MLNTLYCRKIENMEKPVAVIEICSKSVKVVIGYVIDGQVQIIYKNTYDVGHIVENGSIIDYNSLVTALKNINYIEDAEAKLKIKIGEAVVALPPFGINVFQIKQSTNIVSDEGIVSSFDLRNVYSLIRKCNIDKNMTLIDIVPNEYILDNNRAFLVPPIGQNSSTLSVQVKLHVLPSHIYINYRNVINDANLIVKRCIASPQGAVELLGTYKEIPQDYILVDIGSRTTTVSLVGKKEVYDSRFFEWGSDFITEHLVSSFNINECDAEKYKILYGIDENREVHCLFNTTDNAFPSFILLSILAGYIKETLIIYMIIIVHELGHYISAFILGYKIKEIRIYPFGGITYIDKKINSNLNNDLIVAISGVIMQLILFIMVSKINIFNTYSYNIFTMYNKAIIIFNLLTKLT